MYLVDSFPTTEENESIENMRVVYDVQNGRSGHYLNSFLLTFHKRGWVLTSAFSTNTNFF